MPKSGEFHDGILIAFGQTGSGKHHTMLGNEGSSDGLIHLLVEDLSQLLRNETSDLGSSKFEVKSSYVEVSRQSMMSFKNWKIKAFLITENRQIPCFPLWFKISAMKMVKLPVKG